METKPTTWQEQGPFNSLVDMQGEKGATVGHDASLQERKAPKAMPEEDLDAPEPGVKVEAPQGNWMNEITEMVDVINIRNQTSAGISRCTLVETQGAVTERPEKLTEAKEESRKADNPCEEDFPPTEPLNALSAAEYGEKEGFSSLEGEVQEGLSEAEPTEDSQEGAKTPKFLEPAHRDVRITPPLDLTTLMNAGDICNDKTETSTPPSAQSFLSDINSSDDRHPLDSPPFADESGEEEENGADITHCQEQSGRCELSWVGFQPSCSHPEKRDSALPATGSVRQEEAVLPQKHPELCPRGLNQEAAQQVFGQGSPPGSAVAMEPANQGGEASRGFSCVAAVRARSRRVGERTEGENEQTGGVEGQNKSGVEKSEAAVRSESKGLFRYLQAVQTQEFKAERTSGIPVKANSDTRMRTDVHDDSQSDSGVSADFHSFRTLNSSTSMSADSPGPVSTETPIEREIRRAIERAKPQEVQGTPKPTLLSRVRRSSFKKKFSQPVCNSQVVPEQGQGICRKKMQQEIHEESRREQDLVKIGKIPGFYDKGTVRQIKERKQLFETLQISPEFPLTISPKSKTPSWSSTSSEDLNIVLESQDESGTSTPEHTYIDRKATMLNSSRSQTFTKGSDQSSLRGPRFSEGSGGQIIILENSLTVPAEKHYKAKAQVEAIPATDTKNNFHSSDKARGHDGLMKAGKEQGGAGAVSKENPFFKLRSSANLDKVKQDIQEAKEREKELHTLRLSLYGGISADEATSKKEIPVPGPLSNGRSGAYEGRQSADQVSARPSVQSEEERIFHPEIHKSPRTPRQKNPLVQLWESGLVNSYNLEDD